MKILLTHRPGGAFGYITDGWFNAFHDMGHDVRRWDGTIEEWNKFDPDLYMGCSGHRQPIPSNRKTKIAIHVNPYGPVNIEGINENADNINWVLQQKPDAVFGYGFDTDKIFWSYWELNHGIKWVPMPTAADKTIFKTTNNGDRDLDVVYLGGRWSYKGLTIDSYLVPVLRDKNIKYKLYGWGDWQKGLCSGMLAEDKVVDFFNSGKVAPCIAEKHTHNYGIDIPERVWKVALCGALAIHDHIPTLRDNMPSALIAKNSIEYKEMILSYCNDSNSNERIKLARQQYSDVINAHTYHHRLAGLLSALGFSQESSSMLG